MLGLWPFFLWGQHIGTFSRCLHEIFVLKNAIPIVVLIIKLNISWPCSIGLLVRACHRQITVLTNHLERRFNLFIPRVKKVLLFRNHHNRFAQGLFQAFAELLAIHFSEAAAVNIPLVIPNKATNEFHSEPGKSLQINNELLQIQNLGLQQIGQLIKLGEI